MKLTIEDYLNKLTNKDYIKLIKRRIPNYDDNIIVGICKIKHNTYISVSFYFEEINEFPEILYTHIYVSELEEYFKGKCILCGGYVEE